MVQRTEPGRRRRTGPDEPPGEIAGSHGFNVRPRSGLYVVGGIDSSGVLVRPTMIAPARRTLATRGESSGAMRFARAGKPFGVAWPATSMFSLIVIATPCSGPIDFGLVLGSMPCFDCASSV